MIQDTKKQKLLCLLHLIPSLTLVLQLLLMFSITYLTSGNCSHDVIVMFNKFLNSGESHLVCLHGNTFKCGLYTWCFSVGEN